MSEILVTPEININILFLDGADYSSRPLAPTRLVTAVR
jgi:hypothetical protein